MKLADLATGSDWIVWIVFAIFAVLSIILLIYFLIRTFGDMYIFFIIFNFFCKIS